MGGFEGRRRLFSSDVMGFVMELEGLFYVCLAETWRWEGFD